MTEYNFIHTRRSHGHNRGERRGQQYSSGQRRGEFSFDTIHGMKMTEVEYRVPPKEEREQKRREFSGSNGREGVRSKFLKMLANEHEAELREKLGMTTAEINMMKEGRSVPGYNVHHKLPIHGGGKNEFSNFILTPYYPHDQWHHDVMDSQIAGMQTGQSRTIKLPYTDEMIYDPKKYGYYREGQMALPNYASKVNPNSYPQIYTAAQVADSAKRRRELQKVTSPDKDNNSGGKSGGFSFAAIMARQGGR